MIRPPPIQVINSTVVTEGPIIGSPNCPALRNAGTSFETVFKKRFPSRPFARSLRVYNNDHVQTLFKINTVMFGH